MLQGSQLKGRFDTYFEDSTVYKFYATQYMMVKEQMKYLSDPVAITGKLGTVAIFDCNTLHASGHNLSAKDRWQIYLCYNRCTNRPIDIDDPRPDYVRSTNWEPMTFLNNDSIVTKDLS